MNRLFGENALDRGLMRLVVQSYANINGLPYEEAHAKLAACMHRVGEFQEISSDNLLKPNQVVNRNAVKTRRNIKRVRVEQFAGPPKPFYIPHRPPDDDAGHRPDDPTTIDDIDDMFPLVGATK